MVLPVYQIVRVERLKTTERRGVVLLTSIHDSRVDAVAVFRGLCKGRERELRSRFETWIDGVQHQNRWFHGFDRPDCRDCFVFKWKEENVGQRLYGFLCHPLPRTKPRFLLCVLTNHGEKPHPQWETDPAELDVAKSLRVNAGVQAAIRWEFPDQAPGSAKWRN
jgi:hypothetical protein